MAQKTQHRGRDRSPDPAELRGIFGQNLRHLSAAYPSVSGLCRDLGINRTQFNRYLSGESFPRPDVLHQICSFFGVDARILLERVEDIGPATSDLLNHPMLAQFFGPEPVAVDERLFPNGFYRFVRQAFIGTHDFMTGLVFVKRDGGYTFLRGYEPRQAIRKQGLSTNPQAREFRGLVMRQEEGVMAIVTHRNALACSLNFLTPERSFQSNLWEGYATRTVREKVTGRRATRMVYEHLGTDRAAIFRAARGAGLIPREEVPPFHARLLQPDQAFS
ncbi:helix-turn-helix transcriptional regulator [Roseovarius sp. CAU 1744]|uniref:helix-turn-helix domain-containing protein n=1 Tax=Roseovarius sp. CAU 1744 TaxID=3140368 RepID=UPI00325BBD3B